MTKDGDLMRFLTWINILLITVIAFGIGYQVGQNKLAEPTATVGSLFLDGKLVLTISAIYVVLALVMLALATSRRANNRADDVLLALILEMQGRVASLTQQSRKMQEQLSDMKANPTGRIQQVIQYETDLHFIQGRRAEAEDAVSVIAHARDQST
jgi:hypothetical protein